MIDFLNDITELLVIIAQEDTFININYKYDVILVEHTLVNLRLLETNDEKLLNHVDILYSPCLFQALKVG